MRKNRTEQEMRKVCPHCKRPYPVDPPPRARGGGPRPGVEHAAAAAAADMTPACSRVLAVLRAHPGAWVSAAELRDVGGDGPRRARQLRDEHGWPIEVRMGSNPRQAWYRLAAARPVAVDDPDHGEQLDIFDALDVRT